MTKLKSFVREGHWPTLVGAFLSMIYLLSGSLFAGMLIHALMDLHTGHTLKSVYARDAEAGA